MGEPEYEGIPISKLPIDAIEWSTEAENHIRHRADRKDRPKEFNVEPEWATEAAADYRQIRAVAGTCLVIVGRSRSAPPRQEGDEGRLLKVFLRPKNLDEGTWEGVTAFEANDRDRRKYKEI